MKKLHERAMLVDLTISTWSGKKRDSFVSEEVLTAKQSERDAGDWVTHLIPKQWNKAIGNVASKCRIVHAKYTLPWMDGGLRILPNEMFMTYSAEMRKVKDEFFKVIDEFFKEYPSIVSSAERRLGRLMENIQLPSEDEIRNRYSVRVDILPIPNSSDFRLDMEEEQEQEIRKQVQETVDGLTGNAMRELWSRMGGLVEKLQQRLHDPDKILRKSLVSNLVEFCETVPKMNVTGDEKIEEMRKEVLEKLSKLDTEELKDDKAGRVQAAKKAKEILEKMKSYCG